MENTDERKTLIEDIKKRVSGLKKPKNVLVIGKIGVGKSSFINTAIAAMTGRYDHYADVGSGDLHITTTLYKISSDTYWKEGRGWFFCKKPKLCLPNFIDTMGLDPVNDATDSTGHIQAPNEKLLELIIKGKLPGNCDLLETGKKLKQGKTLITKEHQDWVPDLIIIVVSSKSEIPTAFLDIIYKETKRNQKATPVFGVMTNVDDPKLEKETFENKREVMCNSLGIGKHKFLGCANHVHGQETNPRRDVEVLRFLRELCNPLHERRTLVSMKTEEDRMCKCRCSYFLLFCIVAAVVAVLVALILDRFAKLK